MAGAMSPQGFHEHGCLPVQHGVAFVGHFRTGKRPVLYMHEMTGPSKACSGFTAMPKLEIDSVGSLSVPVHFVHPVCGAVDVDVCTCVSLMLSANVCVYVSECERACTCVNVNG